MRIISKYKDYYDGVQSLGMDKTLIFHRMEEIKSFEPPPDYNTYLRNRPDTFELEYIHLGKKNGYQSEAYFNFSELIIGFCGKLIPAFKLDQYENKEHVGSQFFYDSKHLLSFFEKLKISYKKLYFCNWYHQGALEPSEKDINDFFLSDFVSNDYSSWFQLFACPVFTLASNTNIQKNFPDGFSAKNKNRLFVNRNPSLKKLAFYKVKDPYTAYQDISQFLGGVLTKREDISNKLSDLDKIKQHGFDPKYGFRNRPKKK